jgi:glycosyltransferase involved in cell wall biosynthesis
MNYWLLTTEYPPFFGGGISTYCYQTAVMLSRQGHRVSVFINDSSIKDIREEQQGSIRITRFNPSRTNSSSFLGHVTNISYEFAHIVKWFIEKEGKPDIIEAQEYLGIAYYLLQYKKLLYGWCDDVPILITMHSPSFLYMEYNHVPLYRYPNFWICEMERFCLQAADHVISPSQFMIEELGKRFLLTNKNIKIVPNPFEPTNYSQSVETDQPGEIVFYGKLTAQKGAFQLLAYFKKLWDNGFERPLFLLGGQDIVYHPEGIAMGDIIRKKFHAYIQKGLLRLEKKIEPADIPGRLSKAEVVIIPSNNDNLPYVVFEMMSLGKIILVSKQGGHREVVEDGKDGFIFDHEQPETFSQQLHRVLALDQSQRRNISKNGLDKVKGFCGYATVYATKIRIMEALLQRSNYPGSRFPFVRSLHVETLPPETISANKKLSVIIPYFNMGKYIEEAVESVKHSDYPLKEILIVNDGSTDSYSLSVLDTYRNREGIRVIDKPNGGLASVRNLGAREATGEYLAFLDADDLVMPGYYSKAVKVLDKYENVHFAGCWTKYFEGSSNIWPAFLPEPPLILYHNLVNSSALVYKRSSFLRAGLNDMTMLFQGLEDYESVVSMLAHGHSGIAFPEVLFEYRVRSDSMIRGISRAKKLLLYQHISSKHQKFYATFAADIFNLLNANGPGISLDNPSLDLHLADRLPFGGRASLKMIGLIKRNRVVKTLAYKLYRVLKK